KASSTGTRSGCWGSTLRPTNGLMDEWTPPILLAALHHASPANAQTRRTRADHAADANTGAARRAHPHARGDDLHLGLARPRAQSVRHRLAARARSRS